MATRTVALGAAAAAATTACGLAVAAQSVSPLYPPAFRSLPLISHHGLLQRRLRSRLLGGHSDGDWDGAGDGSGPDMAVLYQGYGTHYVDLWVGSPPQRQTVIVDTGSGFTAFPCSGCIDCGDSYHIDGYFVEEQSTTFRQVDCGQCFKGNCKTGTTALGSPESKVCSVEMGYSEGSRWSAYEAIDRVYVGGPHDSRLSEEELRGSGRQQNPLDVTPFALTFGCQTVATKLFKTQLADGIMGMENTRTAFWSQMHEAGAMSEKGFSLCYSRQPTASRDGTEAGTLTMGGSDSRLHSSRMVYARNLKVLGRFTLELKNIYLWDRGGESGAFTDSDDDLSRYHFVDLGRAGRKTRFHEIIVDSGTTLTLLDRKFRASFESKWEEVTGRVWPTSPVVLTEEELENLPTILFQFSQSASDGATEDIFNITGGGSEEGIVRLASMLDDKNPNDVLVAMPPSHYMMYDQEEKTYQSGIYLKKSSGSTLGANFMMGHDVHFDLKNGRIGFAESESCNFFDITSVKVAASVHAGSDCENSAEEGETEEPITLPQSSRSSSLNGGGEKDFVKLGVLSLVVTLAALFVFYRRRLGRYDMEAIPIMDDLQEEYTDGEGYSDDDFAAEIEFAEGPEFNRIRQGIGVGQNDQEETADFVVT